MAYESDDRSWPLSSLLALLGFVFVPAALTVAGLSAGSTDTATELENVPDGLAFSEVKQERSLSRIDRWVESRIPGRELAFEFDRTTTRILDDNYTGAIAASDRVQLGRDGWLFLRDASDQPCASDGVEHEWQTELRRVEGLLRRAGKQPLIAIAPDRGVIAPNLLGTIDNPCQVHNTDVVDRLAMSATVIDLSESVSGEAHILQLDTHWSPEGAMAGARQIVEAISPGTWEDRTVRSEIVERRGDLDGLLGYENTETVNLLTVAQPSPTYLEPLETSLSGRPLVRARTEGAAPRHVLLIHDSFGGYATSDESMRYLSGLGATYLRPWFERVDNVRIGGTSAHTIADQPVVRSLADADSVAILIVQRTLSIRLKPGGLSTPLATALIERLGVVEPSELEFGSESFVVFDGLPGESASFAVRADDGAILDRVDFPDRVALLVDAGTELVTSGPADLVRSIPATG